MLRAFGVQEMESVPNAHVAVYSHLYITSFLGDSQPYTDLCRHRCGRHAGRHPYTYKYDNK